MSDFEDEEGVDEPVLEDDNEEEGQEEEVRTADSMILISGISLVYEIIFIISCAMI